MANSRTLLTAAALLLAGLPARAADYPVTLDAVRVGLPPAGRAVDRDEAGRAAHVAKLGAWAPVFVDLDVTSAVNDPAELVIESPDSDGVTATLVLPLNLSGVAGKVSAANLGVVGYVRPTARGDVTVTLRRKDGGRPLADPFRVGALRPRDPLTYLVLSLGSPLPGFDLPKAQGEADSAVLRGGRVELAAVTDVSQLPDQWFGYDAADLVVLNTGNSEFFGKLFGESGSASDRARRAALLEWVRRGGRLVVGVGDSASAVAGLTAARPDGSHGELYRLLPLEIRGARQLGKLTLSWGAGASSRTGTTISAELTATRDRFTIADLGEKPGRTARVMVPIPEPQAKPEDPVAAQAAYGLGRVTVIGFDLDRAPFADFPQRPAFWDWVLREGGSARATAGTGKPRPAIGTPEEEDRIAAAIRTHSDTFDGVPVVSFGWVAILIALYILLIGPVEYFFLKRVLGRLELTWITFPIIVLTVSAAAYYSAYSLKGRDLKVNKIDVVDVDPASGRVYGTTWLTVFSPRTETYTVGVTPGDGWGDAAPGTAVTATGAADAGGRGSILRRSYTVHADGDAVADALENVPVQVWSTKSFAANWSGRFDPAAPTAPARSELYRPAANPNTVTGEFTLNLPVPVLSDCVLFYAGQAYPVPGGTIRSGETVRRVFLGGTPVNQWLQKESGLNTLLGTARTSPAGTPAPAASRTGLPLLGMLFHEASLQYGETVVPDNSSLRRLDQSWRLSEDHRGEVVLVGRAVLPVGPGEETLAGPGAASRLWLRGLPGSGERQPMPQGSTGRQETWVRVYLPVK